MDDIAIARALHVLSIVHWIGGVSMVTLVILPAVRRLAEPDRRMEIMRMVEHGFARQARISVTLAGLTGLYMTWRLDAWYRFLEPGYWWMHAMVLVWAIFMLALFVVEPRVVHQRLQSGGSADPGRTLARMYHSHLVLLLLAAVTIAAAVLGAHGVLY